MPSVQTLAVVPELGAAPQVVSAPPSLASWSVVSGQDWDQRMLFEALQQNQGVVMDQLLRASGAEVSSGPMAIEDEADVSDNLYAAEAMSLAPPTEDEAEEPEEQQPQQQQPLPPEAPPVLPAQPPPAGDCQRLRVNTKGTNQHYFVRTCRDCRAVLERTRKEPKAKAAPKGGAHRSPEVCHHLNVSRHGTNAHVWKWHCRDCGLRREGQRMAAAMGHGAIGARNMEGPDTEAVKVLELAGTVVMVQESGGLPVPLESLPEIVASCVRIYTARHPVEPPLSQAAPAKARPPRAVPKPKQPPPQPQASPAGPSEPPAAAKAASPSPMPNPQIFRLDASDAAPHQVSGPPQRPLAPEAGISREALLQSGKRKGSSFGDVYDNYPDYVSWVLSQGDGIQARSLQDFQRYSMLRRHQEHRDRSSAFMVEKAEGSEDDLLAVLDTGCNQTCHGALWFQNYMRACGQEYHALEESGGESLKGIGGRVRSLGKRVLRITLQLSDGTLAHGTVQSTELEGSEAPLLMSCGAQKQLGLVLDLGEQTAFSKVFGQNLDLVDRDGLPAVRLLPQQEDDSQAFAMAAVGQTSAADEESETLDVENDFWEKGPDHCWIRHHVHPRKLLYDPETEPSQEQDIEAVVSKSVFRKTIAINPETGERAEFRDRWREQGEQDRDVQEYVGGPWTGYTYFYIDESHCHRSDVEATAMNAEVESGDFVKFDEEKSAILTKGFEAAHRA